MPDAITMHADRTAPEMPTILEALGRVALPKGYKLDRFSLSWIRNMEKPTWRIERPGQAVFDTRITLGAGRASQLRREASRRAAGALDSYIEQLAAATGMRPSFINAPDMRPEDLTSEDLTSEDLAAEDLASENLTPESATPMNGMSRHVTANEAPRDGQAPLDLAIMLHVIQALVHASDVDGNEDKTRDDAAWIGGTYDLQRRVDWDASKPTCTLRRKVTLIGSGPGYAPGVHTLEEIVERAGFPQALMSALQADWDARLQALFPSSVPAAIKLDFEVQAPSAHDRLAARALLDDIEARMICRYPGLVRRYPGQAQGDEP